VQCPENAVPLLRHIFNDSKRMTSYTLQYS